MIHGIYLKSKPHRKWHLVSVATSAEVAHNDIIEFEKKIKKEGNTEAIVAIQSFESSFYIPEFLSEIKSTEKIMYS